MHAPRWLAVTSILAACGAAHAPSPTHPAVAPATSAPPPLSAGDVRAAAAPDRSAAEIARLRAQGPEALDALLADYDRTPAGAARDRKAATIDKVAGQRYATVSRMYWYTELAQAEAAARASGKPILSLRMLGRLDEDLSCANSRFFRTILYADATLGPWLRDHFVLHWSSERPVPKVTIDFGDGRVLERTVTGNSAHFVLDAEGHPLDVLPGLYAPSAFRAELTQSLALAAQVRLAPSERRDLVVAYHEQHARDRQAWAMRVRAPVSYVPGGQLSDADVRSILAAAQRRTVSKASIEIPDLRIVDVGVDPGPRTPDLSRWAAIGQRLYGWDAAAPRHLIDARSTALVLALAGAERPGLPRLDEPARAAILARLDRTLAADSAQNELSLRVQIDGYLATRDADFATLDAFLYASVFATPASDPWLGLLPRDAFLALPGDGVLSQRAE